MYIELKVNDSRVSVNASLITSIREDGDKCAVCFIDCEDYITVSQSYDEVKALLDYAMKKTRENR